MKCCFPKWYGLSGLEPVCRYLVRALVLPLLFAMLSSCGVLPQRPQKAAVDELAFSAFPEKYRREAMKYEKMGDLRRALISWQIVSKFEPHDEDVSRRIAGLRQQIQIRADKHFQKGLNHLRTKSAGAARRQFLLVLMYDPGHEQALEYLRNKLSNSGFVRYTTRRGDTFSGIARDVYGDPDKGFLIAYLSGLDDRARPQVGVTLELPVIDEELMKQPTHTEEMLNMAQAMFKAKDYQKALSLAEDVLQYNPANREAGDLVNGSLYQLALLHIRRKEYLESLMLLRRLDRDYKNVGERVKFLEKHLQKKAEVHYNTGVKYFVAEELDKAIGEWQETLRLNPAHPKAKKDIKKARRLLDKLKKLQ